MNNVIIRNNNLRVKEEDMVFHCGDFCFHNSPGGKEGEGGSVKAKDWIKKLNGNYVFLKGNHDKNNSLRTPILSCVIQMGGRDIFLCHKPEDIDPRYTLAFVGHVHQHWKFKRIQHPTNRVGPTITMVNVGVDVWGFVPRSFNEIMAALKKWEAEERQTQKTQGGQDEESV